MAWLLISLIASENFQFLSYSGIACLLHVSINKGLSFQDRPKSSGLKLYYNGTMAQW